MFCFTGSFPLGRVFSALRCSASECVARRCCFALCYRLRVSKCVNMCLLFAAVCGRGSIAFRPFGRWSVYAAARDALYGYIYWYVAVCRCTRIVGGNLRLSGVGFGGALSLASVLSRVLRAKFDEFLASGRHFLFVSGFVAFSCAP
jgi:hypothetical protein